MIPYQATIQLPNHGVYRVLLDADILLELLYNRSPFVEEVEFLLAELRELSILELYITDKAIRRISVEHEDIETATVASHYFRERFQERIIDVDKSIIERARETAFPDFESAIEHACSIEHRLHAIISQNPSNYPNSAIPIWSILELRERLNLECKLTLNKIFSVEDIFRESYALIRERVINPKANAPPNRTQDFVTASGHATLASIHTTVSTSQAVFKALGSWARAG